MITEPLTSQGPLSVAVLGCGRFIDGKVGWAIGHVHAHAFLDSGAPVQLYGVDVNADNLAAFGDAFALPAERLFRSTDELYAVLTPDIVTIGTWPGSHVPMALEAIAAGVRGILCEKPIGADSGQVHALQQAVEAADVRVAVAHQRRHDPHFQAARRLLTDGAIGEGIVLEARVADGWDLLSFAVHWIDLAAYLFDSDPDWVMAGIDFEGETRYDHPVENGSVILAQYPGNRQALFVTGPDNPQEFPITLRGSTGLIRVGEGRPIQVLDAQGLRLVEPAPGPAPWTALASSLVAAVTQDGPMLCDLRRTAAATNVVFAAYESARTMRMIATPAGGAMRYAPLELVRHAAANALTGRRIVLYADSHFGSGGADGLANALGQLSGSAVRRLDAELVDLTDQDLVGADLLVVYHSQTSAHGRTRETVATWVQSGGPLLAVHAAVGGWVDWPEWQQWLGRVWEWGVSNHPIEACELTVCDGSDVPWRRAWLPSDEVYVDLRTTGPCVEVVTATIESGTLPAAWISGSHRNIGVWLPGHRGDIWAVPALREGLTDIARRVLRVQPSRGV